MAALRSLVAAVAAATLVDHASAWYAELPPCIEPFKPFVYAGCFTQLHNPEVLGFRTNLDASDMTVEKCVATCKGNGYRYAGIEYYGQCYCGQTVNGPLQGDDKCNFPCNGDKGEICGGDNTMSIYQDPTFLPTSEADLEDYVPVGCWSDDADGKALVYRQDQLPAAGLTTTQCLNACKDGGFPFAGTEYGGECYCGVVVGNGTKLVAPEQCNMPCNGDSSEQCGGPNRLTLYVAKDLQSLEPCGYTPPESSVTTSTTTSTTSTAPPDSTTTTTTAPESSTTTTSTTSTTSTTAPVSTTTTSCKTTTTSTSTSCKTTTTSSTSTSCKTTSTSKPTTTSTTTSCNKPTTTTKPTTTSCKTTTTVPLCTATITAKPECEYKCGKWCSNDLPDWNDGESCKGAISKCKLQVASCLKNAGWPGSLKCFDFAGWCADIAEFCSKCRGPKCGKPDCYKSKPPQYPPPAQTTTVFPCTAKPTTTAAPTTTKPATTTTQCPIPTVTNICKQPSNAWWGYGPGNPVGGIELPVVTCNDLKEDFDRYPFKLYNQPDSHRCGGYTRPQVPNACADACKEQYDDCKEVYVQGCGSNRRRSDANYFQFAAPAGSLSERTYYRFTDNPRGAADKCKAQYDDCLAANKNINIQGKCPKWATGW